MTRMKGILAAGTLTGLVLITLLAFGFHNSQAAGVDAANVQNSTQVMVPNEPTVDPAAQDAVQAWQEYSSQLENTVRTLQARESQYQTELNNANQTIMQLQNQINSANSAPVQPFTFSGEAHEHEHEGFGHDD